MMQLFAVVLFSAFLAATSAQDCTSNMGKRCLPKSENPSWASLYGTGDPCFVYNGKRSCFISSSMLHPCTCTANCGCSGSGGETVPDCPASSKPNPVDCSADQAKYCSQGSDNTMCAYCNVKADCAFCKHDLSQEDKTAILDLHNQLRAKIANGQEAGQPKAANMNKLQWSDELAKMAQRWADQCPNYHDPNRKSPDFPSQPGQNMADSWNSANSVDYLVKDKVQAWYNEVQNWPASNVGAFSENGATGTVGHFTQVAWAQTQYIGCGAIYYKDANPDFARYPYRKTLVCNYFPAGNWRGEPVYIVGEPGSQCQSGKSEDGLCLP